MSGEFRDLARAAFDSIAPDALGAAAAPRVNVSIIARALVLADEASRSDIECYFLMLGRGVYAPADVNGRRVHTLAEADPDTVDKVFYLVDRGLAEVQRQPDGAEHVVLRIERFREVA
jgi:hypothetical protein